MALGFRATNPPPDVRTLAVPSELAPALRDALEHLPEATGLEFALEAGEPLRAPPEQLAELLAAAIDEAGDRVATAASALLHEEGSAGDVRARSHELNGLLDLLDSLDG